MNLSAPSRIDLRVACLALALAILPSAIARADEPDPEVSSEPAAATRDIWDRMIAVELIGGLDTPYGVFGGAIVISPIRHLALDVGGGVSRDGGRVAGGARLVLPHANGALGLRVGFAGGPLTWESAVPGHNVPGDEVHTRDGVQHQIWEFAGFVDASLSLEWRFDLGIYARLLFGVEHALTGPSACEERIDGEIVGACGTTTFQPTRTYVGLAVGYAFDI